jgi:putative phage-type endonuclease
LRVFTLEQGSPEWLLWRKTGIGSSDAPVIVNGEHFRRTRESLWLEKLGRLEPKPMNPFVQQRMERGNILEKDARTWYEHVMELEAQPLVAMHPFLDWCKGSLDGYVPSTRTVLEIKSPGNKDHNTALQQQVPEKYIPQLNHLILVTGSSRVHYLSYHPGRTYKERYALISYMPEPEVLADLMKKEETFWNCIQKQQPPHDHLFE